MIVVVIWSRLSTVYEGERPLRTEPSINIMDLSRNNCKTNKNVTSMTTNKQHKNRSLYLYGRVSSDSLAVYYVTFMSADKPSYSVEGLINHNPE